MICAGCRQIISSRAAGYYDDFSIANLSQREGNLRDDRMYSGRLGDRVAPKRCKVD
jgi:hypothetical protein